MPAPLPREEGAWTSLMVKMFVFVWCVWVLGLEALFLILVRRAWTDEIRKVTRSRHGFCASAVFFASLGGLSSWALRYHLPSLDGNDRTQ